MKCRKNIFKEKENLHIESNNKLQQQQQLQLQDTGKHYDYSTYVFSFLLVWKNEIFICNFASSQAHK